MFRQTQKSGILVKLGQARRELDDALTLATPAARFDPIVVPPPVKNRLAEVRDHLDRIIDEVKACP